MKAMSSYIGGIDKDTSKNRRKPETYYDATNIRVVLNDELASSAITTLKSYLNLDLKTKLLAAALTKSIKITTDVTIIGFGSLRELMIIFIIDDLGNSYIFGLTINDLGIQTAELIYSDKVTTDGTKLNLSKEFPIRGFESHYESENYQYIYFSDYRNDTVFNPLRVINIKDPDILVSGVGVSVSNFDLFPKSTLKAPIITGLTTGGSLKSGLVQYAIQYYNEGGNSSAISPLSNIINLTDSREDESTDLNYTGTDRDVNTGKTVKILINSPDTNFDRILVYAIHYSNISTLPTISVLPSKKVINLLYFEDSGDNYVDVITAEDFVKLKENFTCKTLKQKDNILFASNIITKNFNFEYDARAYRFNISSTTTTIQDNYGSSYTIDGNNFTIGGSLIDPTHDCINPYNNYTDSFPTDEKYVFNGTRLGGTGLNVNYYFELEDNNVLNESTDLEFPEVSKDIYGRYKSFAYYLKVSNKDWQRDEVYRFGLIGFNDKMQPSPVKWIGDIRIPSHNEVDTIYTNVTSDCRTNGYSAFYNTQQNATSIGSSKNKNLVIKFNVNNLPPEVEYYQIVYVKREDKDKTVLAEGLLGETMIYYPTSGDNTIRPTATGFHMIPPTGYYTNSSSYRSLVNLVTPEILFNSDFISNTPNTGVYLRIDMRSYTPFGTANELFKLGSAYNNASSIEVYSLHGYYDSLSTSLFYDVNRTYKVDSISDGTTNTDIDVGLSLYYNNFAQTHEAAGTTGEHYGKAGTRLFLVLDSDIDSTPISGTFDTYYASLKVKRSNQYGGDSYSTRLYNEYIPCSMVTPAGTNYTYAYGDVFVNNFEYLHTIWKTDATSGQKICSIHNIPVVSNYNLNLRSGKQSKNYFSSTDKNLITENAGTYEDGSYKFVQSTDLYLYNSVYSRIPDIFKFYPVDESRYNDYEYNDVLTKYSNTRVLGSIDDIDPWTIFLSNNSKEVESSFGSINSLNIVNNQLVFTQDKAIGIWAVNQKELIQTNNPGALGLGTGGVLDNYVYFTKDSGSSYQSSIVNTPVGLFYVDEFNKSINLFSDKISNLTKITGNSRFLSNIIMPSNDYLQVNDGISGVEGIYNPEFEEVTFVIKALDYDGNVVNRNLVYSIVLNKFICSLSKTPIVSYNHNRYTLTTNNINKLYLNDKGNDYGKLYDDIYEDAYITLLINPEQGNTNVFIAHLFNEDIIDSSNTNIYDEAIKTVECWNSYQHSVIKDFSVNPEDIVRRNRLFRFYIPRESNAEGSRLSDTHLFSKLVLDNSKGYKRVLYDIQTDYIAKNI